MKAKEWFSAATTTTKILIVVVALALVAIVFASGWISSYVLIYNVADRKFAKERTEFQEKMGTLQEQKAAADVRADTFEQQALEAKAGEQKYILALEALGKEGQRLKEKADAADQKFLDSLGTIDAPADACERKRSICASLRIQNCPCD